MKLTLIAEPEAGETADVLSSAGTMPLEGFNFMLDMMGSIYDEAEPKQDSDANGLLWLDADGKTLTQAEVDALNSAPADGPAPGPGPARGGAARVTPKYRPRTKAETWFKIASGLTKGTIANAERRKKELDARGLPAVAPIPVAAI